VPLLAHHFLQTYAIENGFRAKVLSPEAQEILVQYDWPGNIRELKNLVERLSIMVSDHTITAADLPPLEGIDLPNQSQKGITIPGLSPGKTLRDVRETVEKYYIGVALERHKGNVTQASKSLGIERTNLHKKIKYYDLEK